MSLEKTCIVPEQRTSEMIVDDAEKRQLALAAARLAEGKLIAIENGPVFALAGNADDPYLPHKILEAKGQARGFKPVGLVMPFSRASGMFKQTPEIQNTVLRPLKGWDGLTRRIGGVAFLRAIANPEADIPPCALSDADQNGERTVQVFSPAGNLRAGILSRYAEAHGFRLAMTSLNFSGQKEIVTKVDAEQFVDSTRSDIQLICDDKTNTETSKPKGSYPVIEMNDKGTYIVRPGFLSQEIIGRLVECVPCVASSHSNHIAPKYPDGIIHLNDLSFSEKNATGERLREILLKRILSYT